MLRFAQGRRCARTSAFGLGRRAMTQIFAESALQSLRFVVSRPESNRKARNTWQSFAS